MNEKEFDTKVMKSLISLYNEINEQIESFGEKTIHEHSPELINRRNKISDFITNYAQLYFKGLAYADHMKISEIEQHTIGQKR